MHQLSANGEPFDRTEQFAVGSIGLPGAKLLSASHKLLLSIVFHHYPQEMASEHPHSTQAFPNVIPLFGKRIANSHSSSLDIGSCSIALLRVSFHDRVRDVRSANLMASKPTTVQIGKRTLCRLEVFKLQVDFTLGP